MLVIENHEQRRPRNGCHQGQPASGEIFCCCGAAGRGSSGGGWADTPEQSGTHSDDKSKTLGIALVDPSTRWLK